MTNISTAFAAMKTVLGTLFPDVSGYFQLTNPYDIEENPDGALMQGWGLAMGPGQNTQRLMSCNLSLSRTFSVTLTRARFGGDSVTENKEEAELLLFEDQFLLIRELENDVTLNNNVSGITRIVFLSDAGIEDVVTDNDHYVKLTSAFQMEYFEKLN